MSRIDDPNGDPIPGILERLNALEKQNPLESGSVSAGRLRFIGGLLRIDAGGRVEIVGTLQVDGTSTVTGQFNVNGPFNLAGDGTITGRLTITGPVTITGDVDLTGRMTVFGDIEVTGAGRIKVGNVILEDGKVKAGGMVLDPNIAGGALTFPNGSRLEADGANSGERLIAGDAVVNVGAVSSIRKGASAVSVAPNSVTINASGGDVSLIGGVRVSGLPTYGGTGLPLGTLRATNTGQVERADGT